MCIKGSSLGTGGGEAEFKQGTGHRAEGGGQELIFAGLVVYLWIYIIPKWLTVYFQNGK